MKVRIHFETKSKGGCIEWEADGSYQEFVEEIAKTLISSNGYGFLVGTKSSLRLSLITNIEKLED